MQLLTRCSDGGTGRHAGLKILFPLKECGFDSRSEYFRIEQKNLIRKRQVFLFYIYAPPKN
jgi:hypothetical protein